MRVTHCTILKSILCAALLIILLQPRGNSQTTTINGPAGSVEFGRTVTVLTNGNYVVTDPNASNGTILYAGAVYLYDGNTHALISTLTGSSQGDQVGFNSVTALTNGNYVVRSPYWSNAKGAATWCSGTTGINGVVSSANSLVGNNSFDYLSENGVTALTNGNYIVRSRRCSNGTVLGAGAVTWGNGTTGMTGAVSTSNSLRGSKANDSVGNNPIVELSNGNYLVPSLSWDNATTSNVGAWTWGNGATGISGEVSSTNSLVGSKSSDLTPSTVTPLSNGNYVLSSPNWDNGALTDAGAVTWGNGSTGTTGVISSSNSLVGSKAADKVGNTTALTNGNYFVRSPNWDNGTIVDAGATTWCNGTTGTTGVINSTNSLVGNTASDQVGSGGAVALSNGNYVVISQNWDNGAIVNAGAVTWGNGTTGITGAISSTNSLVGGTANDISDNFAGGTLTALSNGSYVLHSPNWDNGAIVNVGAVTWGNGTTGTTGAISSTNSLVGSTANDFVGNVGAALSNGNYVVNSPNWDNGAIVDAGAATWCNGSTGMTGEINIINSLVGSNAGDNVGGRGTIALTNGNYVVRSSNWDNGMATNAGAVTWGNGTTGITGTVSTANSLVGSTSNDMLSNSTDYALSNGNYIVRSLNWDNGASTDAGAVTWGNGTTGTIGAVSSSNSLVGSKSGDIGGDFNILTFPNGSYAVNNIYFDNGAVANSGAATWGNANTGVSGIINSCNSVLGSITGGSDFQVIEYNGVYNYMIVGRRAENKVYIYQAPNGMSLAGMSDTISVNIAGTTPSPMIARGGCRIIATITPNGASPVASTTTAKLWIESTQPATYVKRHYEITPAINAATSTGKVTLYFTQQEFDDFNAVNSLKLPINASDATGKSNLIIEKRSGTSSNGSGLPSTYPGAPTYIDPNDDDIVWNSIETRWEVSFDVTGFSGFWAMNASVLPVEWISTSGRLDGQAHAQLTWEVQESSVSHYEVEKSSDGSRFIKVATQPSQGDGTHAYSATDPTALKGTGYYRIRQVDLDGQLSYSKLVALSNHAGGSIAVYPNPVSEVLHISGATEGTTAFLTDLSGRVLRQVAVEESATSIDMDGLNSGLYLLKTSDGLVVKVVKE